jgi:mono/diheme cytochrome c family protein
MKSAIKRTTLAAGIILYAVYLAGCSAKRRPLPFEKAVAYMAKDLVIPIEAHRAKDPVPPSEEAIKTGQQIYLQNCTLCHGADGHGDTNLGTHMFPPAMDLTSPHAQHWSDGDLFWIIQNGISLTGMPSWSSSISTTDTWKIAQFIHALPRLDAEEAQAASTSAALPTPSQKKLIAYGRALYHQEGCFMCHQLDRQGGKVGPDLTYEGTRARSDSWLIGHFRNPPAYTPGSIMPPFKNLTEKQLQALMAFLQSLKGPKK